MQLPVQLLKRLPDTHKGDYGHVLVLGSSPGLTGAVCLSSLAALRAGCGLVTVGIPESLNSIFEIKLTEVMSLPLRETKQRTLGLNSFKQIKNFLKKINVLAIGPGASTNSETKKLVLRMIKILDVPQVIDADGVNALVGNLRVLKSRKNKDLVITPHLGEFSRLIKKDISYIRKRRKELAKEFSIRYNLILVLKGDDTIITDGKHLFENKTGNPGLATAGTGDVLTGIISSFLAQGLKPLDAARAGAYMHGLAADIAAKEKTESSLIAGDIIDYLSCAFKKVFGK